MQILGWFHLRCESAHTGRAICTDQWQMWSPPLFTNEWCGREWRQKLSLLIISLLSWSPLGMLLYLLLCLPSALQGTAKENPPVGQKNASGKGGDTSCLESLSTITAIPCFGGREGNAVSLVLMRKSLRSTLSTTVLNICVNFCSTGYHKQKLPQVRNLH